MLPTENYLPRLPGIVSKGCVGGGGWADLMIIVDKRGKFGSTFSLVSYFHTSPSIFSYYPKNIWNLQSPIKEQNYVCSKKMYSNTVLNGIAFKSLPNSSQINYLFLNACFFCLYFGIQYA